MNAFTQKIKTDPAFIKTLHKSVTASRTSSENRSPFCLDPYNPAANPFLSEKEKKEYQFSKITRTRAISPALKSSSEKGKT